MPTAPFDIDAFLALPLTARLATQGPTIRPVWYLWEEGAFWMLTGAWSQLPRIVQRTPHVALVIDNCNLMTGEVRQVLAQGPSELLPFDAARGYRKLSRYLGPNEQQWDARFQHYLHDDAHQRGTLWLHVTPNSLKAKDLSYHILRD